jgi:hypothetical protein
MVSIKFKIVDEQCIVNQRPRRTFVGTTSTCSSESESALWEIMCRIVSVSVTVMFDCVGDGVGVGEIDKQRSWRSRRAKLRELEGIEGCIVKSRANVSDCR